MVWEPRGIFQRGLSFIYNTMEVYMLVAIGLIAYAHPSVNALIFVLLSLLLFHSMTMNIKIRYLWNMIYLSIIFLYGVISTIYKKSVQKKMFKDGLKFSKDDYIR